MRRAMQVRIFAGRKWPETPEVSALERGELVLNARKA